MRRCIAFLLFCCLLLSAASASAQMTAEAREEADAFFARLFQQKNTVGGAVIVNQGGERIYAYFHGRAGKHSNPVTDETVYKIASVTKLISAIGVMQLVEEGKLDLDAPLTLPDGEPIRNPRYPEMDITLRQAMSHTSSIAHSADYTGTPKWSKKYFTDAAPGEAYEYANLNGGLLGSLIERASGQSLNTYMTERVFAPLHINAAYSAALLPDPAKLSYSFAPDGTVLYSAATYLREDEKYDDTCNPDAHYRASVGSLYISLKGLETLGAMLANGGEINGVRILKSGSAYLMRQDQRMMPGSTVTGESPYGLCTYRFTLNGRTWYGHQGWWTGRLVCLFFDPESRMAVVLVMNGNDRSVGEQDPHVAKQMERTLRLIAPWADEAAADHTIIEDEDDW